MRLVEALADRHRTKGIITTENDKQYIVVDNWLIKKRNLNNKYPQQWVLRTTLTWCELNDMVRPDNKKTKRENKMIEKLDIKNGGVEDLLNCIKKINELVDAVNRHEDIIRQIGEWGSSKNECLWCENVTKVTLNDPYAKQRKWIGCVCRFWYDNPNDTLLDYLDKIQTGKNGVEYYAKESGDWFPNCEPVLPTDDTIYKGGDNE